jgi:hypothetical protein
VISQKLSLHHYPTHALRTLSSLLPGLEDDELTARLAALALAHSRFVLLLQSLVHRSSAPILPEHPDTVPKPDLRELTFPAPLSYSPPQPPPKSPPPARSSRRISLFRKQHTHTRTPPPPAEPRALSQYSSSWRRSLFHHRHHASADDRPTGFTPPHRRYVTDNSPSRSSSSSSPLSTSRSTTPSSPSPSPAPSITTPSPHALALATSRTRAPLLRVYIPSSTSPAVPECEEQLLAAGLWPHLSTGDVVCNLGYVPTAPSHTSTWLVFNGSVLVPYSPHSNAHYAYTHAVPVPTPLSLPSPFYYAHLAPSNPVFRIPRIPPLGPRACTLRLVHLPTRVPSPHSHRGCAVAKKYVWTARVVRRRGEEGQVHDQYKFPPQNDDMQMQIRLGEEPNWTEEMGDAWYGEWVLEGDGTREGRQGLLACLAGHKAYWGREWEFVREQSGRGRLWLRLLEGRGWEGGEMGMR